MTRPAADLPDGRLEDELRAAFAAATDDLPATSDPWARTTRAVARSRTRRRAGVLATAAVAAIAVTGVLVPLRSAPPEPSHHVPPQPTVTSEDVTTWPTRGDLADRADLVAEVQQVVGRAEQISVSSVPFLGDVDGVRVALAVTGGGDGNPDLVVLAGPPAAPVATWPRQKLELTAASPLLAAAVRTADGRARLIVVTLTNGQGVSYSTRPLISDQGTVRRQFAGLPLVDGLALTSWTGTVSAVRVSTRGADDVAETLTPVVLAPAGDGTATPPGQLDVATSCAAPAFGTLRSNIANAVSAAARKAGYEPRDVVEARALWCRAVAGSKVMALGVTLADGTALQIQPEESRAQGGGVILRWPVRAVPRGRAMDYPVDVTLSDDEAQAAGGGTHVVSAPGAASVDLVRRNDSGSVVLARVPVAADGAGVVTLAKGSLNDQDLSERIVLVVRDAAGRVVDRPDDGSDSYLGDGD